MAVRPRGEEPSVGESQFAPQTLCCLFQQHKAAFTPATASEALNRLDTEGPSLTFSLLSLCHCSESR